MKLILLSVFIFSIFNLSAQVIFSPEEITNDTILDISDTWITTWQESYLLNNSPETQSLRWEIFKIDGPEEWKAQFSVEFDSGGGFAWGVTSNIDPTFGVNIPLTIAPNDSSLMRLAIRPNLIAGCGTFEVRVTPTSDTSKILAVGTYNYIINTSADCITSANDFKKDQIQLFPNPTNDYFSLTKNNVVEEIQIFDVIGKKILEKPFENGNIINISSFSNGLYLVKMLDKNKATLKTSRLIKR